MCNYMCMKRTKLTALVAEWAKQVGKSEALTRLIQKNISSSMAEKLVAGRYSSEPIATIRMILLKEMARDGFVLQDEAS
jgi:hypothetical protein